MGWLRLQHSLNYLVFFGRKKTTSTYPRDGHLYTSMPYEYAIRVCHTYVYIPTLRRALSLCPPPSLCLSLSVTLFHTLPATHIEQTEVSTNCIPACHTCRYTQTLSVCLNLSVCVSLSVSLCLPLSLTHHTLAPGHNQ